LFNIYYFWFVENYVYNSKDRLFKCGFSESIKHVVIVYKDDNSVGCGAIRLYNEETIEIKRMFVASSERNQRGGIFMTSYHNSYEPTNVFCHKRNIIQHL
jgi:hypothetical protein